MSISSSSLSSTAGAGCCFGVGMVRFIRPPPDAMKDSSSESSSTSGTLSSAGCFFGSGLGVVWASLRLALGVNTSSSSGSSGGGAAALPFPLRVDLGAGFGVGSGSTCSSSSSDSALTFFARLLRAGAAFFFGGVSGSGSDSTSLGGTVLALETARAVRRGRVDVDGTVATDSASESSAAGFRLREVGALALAAAALRGGIERTKRGLSRFKLRFKSRAVSKFQTRSSKCTLRI